MSDECPCRTCEPGCNCECPECTCAAPLIDVMALDADLDDPYHPPGSCDACAEPPDLTAAKLAGLRDELDQQRSVKVPDHCPHGVRLVDSDCWECAVRSERDNERGPIDGEVSDDDD